MTNHILVLSIEKAGTKNTRIENYTGLIMTEIVFVSKEVESIDLYVSNDGKTTALSVTGLAKLCGVHPSTILDLLNRLDDTLLCKPVPKSLECLRGKVFVASGYSVDGNTFAQSARLVNSEAASIIIHYYAHESKVANDTAKNSLVKFLSKGIDRWIKEATGYQESVKPTTATMPLATLETLHAFVGEYIKDAKIIKEEIPGVGTLLSAYKETSENKIELPNPFLLSEYLETKNRKVSKFMKHAFAQFLVGFYRGVSLAKPEKAKYRDGVYIGNSNTYDIDKVPLLDAAWENFSQL